MRSPDRRFPTLVLLLLCPVSAAAQSAPDASGAGDAVDAALQAWRTAAADAGDRRERAAALERLAAIDDPRVTAALLEELQHLGATTAAVPVLDAIGRLPRGTALPDLRQVLLDRAAGDPVRNAAARAVGHQGNRGIDLLVDLLRDGADAPAPLRRAAMAGLAAAGDERAWRGLAPMALRGTDGDRIEALRLLEPARNVRAVTQARLRLLTDTEPLLAAMAWRQLAAEGHSRARTAFDDVLDRVGQSPAPTVRIELILGLAYCLRPDKYDSFMQLAAVDQPHVQTALSMAAGPLATDAKFVEWLVTDVLDRATGLERKVAMTIVGRAPPGVLRPLLQRIRAQLQRPTPEVLELAFAAIDLLAKEPTWPDDVRRLLSTSDPEVRTVALSLLADLGRDDAVEVAQRELDSKHWPLRAAAYRYLTRCRAVSSIPLLIGRYGQEDGQLAVLLDDALFVHTGTRCWQRDDWQAWWRANGKDFELPAWESVRMEAGTSTTGSTAAYYGIPLASKRAIFLIDVSGSMQRPIGTGDGRTRLDEAKRQLRQAVEQLPADTAFDVVAYEGSVKALWGQLHQATPEAKRQVLALIDAVRVGWTGTNIHDALELAFQETDVDTIYLLTDGQPTVGRIVEPGAIADQVRRWNHARQITVHGIALGEKSDLLRRLADESGGRYVFVP